MTLDKIRFRQAIEIAADKYLEKVALEYFDTPDLDQLQLDFDGIEESRKKAIKMVDSKQ